MIFTVGVEPDVLFLAVDNYCPTRPLFDYA